MGFFSRLIKTTAVGGTAAVGAFFFATRNSPVGPLPDDDPLLKSRFYFKYNPSQNQPMKDYCCKKIPLSQIKPQLLEDSDKLVEKFCAGVWGGLGYATQRAYLARKYEGPETADQLWSRRDLLTSSYPVGTKMTDHFEILEHTKDTILVRCGDTPRNSSIRLSDGLFEISAKVNQAEGVAEFGLKSVFYQGLGKKEGRAIPFQIEYLHRLYTQFMMETAVRNVTR